ncbi:hypothetical protein ACSBR2_026632 [Camellia fascicularis]
MYRDFICLHMLTYLGRLVCLYDHCESLSLSLLSSFHDLSRTFITSSHRRTSVNPPLEHYPSVYNVYKGVQARKGSMLLAFGFLVPQGDYIELHKKRHGYRHNHFKRKHKKEACKVHKRSQLAQKKDLFIYEMNVRAFMADESSGARSKHT